jgi:hypothetical protein
MDYKKSYDILVQSAKVRGWSVNRSRKTKQVGYYEIHHIVPRHLGGSDEPNNLVGLTPEEHFYSHWFLANIHGGPMWGALIALCNDTRVTKRQLHRRAIPSFAKCYAVARLKYAESILGDRHPNWKGGKPLCVDCGKQVQLHKASRCRVCNVEFQKGQNHPSYRVGLPKCEECGQELAGYGCGRKRCRTCHNSRVVAGKQMCVECGRELNTYTRSVKRCRGCYAKRNTGSNNINYGKKMSSAQRLKLSLAMQGRPAWRNGRATNETRRVFSQAKNLHALWKTERPGGHRLATMFGDSPSRSYHTIVEYFRNGWLPKADSDWGEWIKSLTQ